MSKGHELSKKRKEDLDFLGRDLARRSGSKCELCDASGVPLTVTEIPPVPEQPDLESCIFLCEECGSQLENRKQMKLDHWRSLGEKIWSEIRPVKIMSVRILKEVSETESWAGELLEELYLDDEEEELVNSSSLFD